MNLNQRQQILALLALAMVGLYVADKLLFTPLLRTWNARAERIARLKAQVRDGAELLKREAALREQWDRMRTNTLSGPKPEAESQMLKAFERWSQLAGVSVSSIRPQWKEAEEEYATLTCRADIGGSLAALVRFLYQVERDALGVKVDSLELTSRTTDGSQLNLVLQISGLLLQPPKTAPK
jgi:Tfp pilus assembly protein PilO